MRHEPWLLAAMTLASLLPTTLTAAALSQVMSNSAAVCPMSRLVLYTELDDGHPMLCVPAVALPSGAAAAAYLQLEVQEGLAAVL